MSHFAQLLVAPGFFSNGPVQTALIVGGGAAIVSGVIGVFTILRGQSFAGHALADISSAGGAGAYLFGVSPLPGFLAMAIIAAGGMEFVQVRGHHERDLVTGIVLGGGLGLTALFLYLGVTTHSTTGAAITVMFGSMFAIPASIIPPALAIGAAALLLIAALYRPLLLASFAPELAAVQGIDVRTVERLYLVALACAVALTAITIGAILSTALLIGPAAIALRLAGRPGIAVAYAIGMALAACWGGILLAYDSYGWTPGHGWPVSFFIVAIIFIGYVLAGFARPPPRRGQAG